MKLRLSNATEKTLNSFTYENEFPINIGDFIELCSEDLTNNPWLAKVVDISYVDNRGTDSQSAKSDDNKEFKQTPAYVNCQWLWNPKESIEEFNINTDPSFYGCREVFLSEETDDSNCDWNSIESIKWKVYVFPFEEYKLLLASDFLTSSLISVYENLPAKLDPTRCWYYRQKLDIQNRLLSPSLEKCIYRIYSDFNEYTKKKETGSQSKSSNKLSQPLDFEYNSNNESMSLPKMTLVPENPERLYYSCIECFYRFEFITEDSNIVSHSLLKEGSPFTLKKSIIAPDIQFTCQKCFHNTSSDSNEPSLKQSSSLQQDSQKTNTIIDCQGSDNTIYSSSHDSNDHLLDKKKLTRYERFFNIFQNAIYESQNSNSKDLLFTDPTVLCNEFFNEFDKCANESKLNPKMSHQKLHEIFQNLKRENNLALRKRIVMGELPLSELVRSDAKDLAPDSVKRRRKAEAQKYFKQQVLLSSNSDSQLFIRKTHKGIETLLNDDEEVREENKYILKQDTHNLDELVDPIENDLNINSDRTHNIYSNTPIESIISSIFIDNPLLEFLDSNLIKKKLSILANWESSYFIKDPSLNSLNNIYDIPTRIETIDFLNTHYHTIPAIYKIIEDAKETL